MSKKMLKMRISGAGFCYKEHKSVIIFITVCTLIFFQIRF